jgi:hypothetical protein
MAFLLLLSHRTGLLGAGMLKSTTLVLNAPGSRTDLVVDEPRAFL